MFSRSGLYPITFLLVLAACGGDDADSSMSAAATSNAGRSGASGGGRAGMGGRSSRGNTGGRPALPGAQACPMTEAEAVGMCTPARGSCTFGTRTCDCISGSNSWACWSQSDCPSAVPAERASCPVVGMTCAPGGRGNCSCTAEGWSCGNQYCPAAEPAASSMCQNGAGRCTYGARMCECVGTAWTCWDPATACPAAPPADRAMCPASGVVCEYPGGSCTCNAMSGWRCGRGVMRDEDAGVPPARAPAAGIGGSGGS